MNMRVLFIGLVLMLLAACSAPSEPILLNPTEKSATATKQFEPLVPTSTSEPDQVGQATTETEEVQPIETTAADCPGEKINIIGEGIADEYDFVNYSEVMTWFCSGAEFEDILVALQTEEQTDAPAEEMLLMLADGLSWEDIWLVVGLTE
jgi:alkylation response protein AidB-like acyl-CoA dehydrogenase